LNFNRIVPGTVRSLVNNKRPVIRSDGAFLRDYFYIEDGANSYMLLAEKMGDKRIHGEAFNFSTEQPKTVLEIVEKIIWAMGSDLEPEILNQATNEIRDQYLSAEKARVLLNWKPTFSLENGLKRTVEWYKAFFTYY
jgi:CDP-glucose 4,6-dehydratase